MTDETKQDAPTSPLGRNDRCHCGSGKKYKQCCLAADEAAAREAREQAAREAAAEADAATDDDGEQAEEHDHDDAGPSKGKRHGTDQPWKRGPQVTLGQRKSTTRRRVGS